MHPRRPGRLRTEDDAALADDKVLDFANAAAIDLEPRGDEGRLLEFSNHAEEGDLAGVRVRQVLTAYSVAGGVPDALTKS
jgi:hypothetical protein